MKRSSKYLATGITFLAVYATNMGLRMSNALDLSEHLSKAKQIVPRARAEYESAKESLRKLTVVHKDGKTQGEDNHNFYVGLMNEAQQDMVTGILLESDLTNQIQSERRKAFSFF